MNRAFGLRGQADRLKGALRSGSPAAHLALFLKGLSLLTRPFDKAIYPILDNDEVKDGNLPPCVLIVGPPRSGSTIICQILIRTIPCVYISNFHVLFPNYASSYMLRNNLFGTKLVDFHNYYGYTSSIYDVSEGNEIFAAFFRGNAGRRLIRERFIKFLYVMKVTQERPLIFKNLRAYPDLSRLHDAVPEVIFLRIKRDTQQIVESVVKAYHELGTFNPVPSALRSLEIEDPVEFAVRQVLEIERTIDLQKGQIEQSKWLEVGYEDFCSDPWAMTENLAQKYLNVEVRRLRKEAVPELRVSKRVKVNQDEAIRISLLLRKFMNAEG